MPASVEAGGDEDPGAAEEPGEAPATVEPGELALAVFAPSYKQNFLTFSINLCLLLAFYSEDIEKVGWEGNSTKKIHLLLIILSFIPCL